MRIVDIDKGYSQLRKEMAAASKARVEIGVHGTNSSEMVIIASTHEFGSEKKNIPQRSFLRSAFDANRKKYRKMIQRMLPKILELRITTTRALSMLGLRIQTDVIEKIDSNIPPANAIATIKKKGSSHTLIDTGQLKQSIKYVVKM